MWVGTKIAFGLILKSFKTFQKFFITDRPQTFFDKNLTQLFFVTNEKCKMKKCKNGKWKMEWNQFEKKKIIKL